MATQTHHRPTAAEPAAATRGLRDRLDIGDVARFTAAVALFAILADATVGHALAWENDPYWTYWITKTFLIATVFGLGTAWFGIGAKQGAAITVVHTVVLTVYYWSLSPVGLPSHPDWLDLEHTWLTGVPIHFGVIYLGYLGALWLWRRRTPVASASDEPSLRARAAEAVGVGVVAVVVMGALEALAIGEFQGVTWYVVRLLITASFLLAWQGIAGRDLRAAIAGAVVLTAALTAYSHFLGPIGLPDTPIRIFERAAPGATVHWLDYREEALMALPITFLTLLAAFAFLARDDLRRLGDGRRRSLLAFGIGALLLAGVGGAIAPSVGINSSHASVNASGGSQTETGAYYRGRMVDSTGTIALNAIDRNPRVTPLPPHDRVAVDAAFTHPDGHMYTVTADQPVVDDPMGRFTTWWGVGLDVWHHGRSGIGTNLLPATESKVAVFALGRVARDGNPIAAGVPVHVMTMDHDRVEVDVGDPTTPVPGLPDGHLRAMWMDATVSTHEPKASYYIFGLATLGALFVLVGAGLRAESGADSTVS